MRIQLFSMMIVAGIALATTGCGDKAAETADAASPAAAASAAPATTGTTTTAMTDTSKPKGSLKVGDMAICAVCAVKDGTKTPEHVKDVITYKDKSYGFCNESEKAEFISNPDKYAIK